MRNSLLLSVAAILAMACHASAEDTKIDSSEKDHKLIEGAWRIVAVTEDGKEFSPRHVRELVVVNGSDGTWTMQSGGEEIDKGTSTFDASKRPKTIDFASSKGDAKGIKHLGIYELGETSRRLCFAEPGKPRPTAFVSKPGSGHTLVEFERIPE